MAARRRQRRLSRAQTITRAVLECAQALDKAHRHPYVSELDLRRILGAVYALKVDNGTSLRLTHKGEQQ